MKIIEYFNQKNSILRRSAFALVLNIPPSLIALLLNYFATKLSDQFGLFYLSISTINIIFAGSLILNLVITEICLNNSNEINFDVEKYRDVLSKIISICILIFILLIPLSFILNIYIKISFLLIISIIFSSIVSYVSEMGRVYLQCKDNFFLAGIYNIVWSLTRAIATLIVLSISSKIWISIIFYGISSLLPFLYIYFRDIKYLKIKLNIFSNVTIDAVKNIFNQNKYKLEFLSAYLCFSIFNFSELINTYLYLDELSLNILSASLIIPKGIIVFSIPLVHIFYVTLIKTTKKKTYNFYKGIFAIVFFTLLISLFFKITSNYYCGNDFGISLCNQKYLFLSINNAILLVVFRSLLVYLSEVKKLFSVYFFPICTIIYFFYVKFSPISVEKILEMQFNFTIFLILTCILKNFISFKIKS